MGKQPSARQGFEWFRIGSSAEVMAEGSVCKGYSKYSLCEDHSKDSVSKGYSEDSLCKDFCRDRKTETQRDRETERVAKLPRKGI